MNTIFLCAILGFLSFFFVVIPITGGVVLNPVLALFFTPQAAISLSVFFFMLNSGIKATLFREYIIWKEVYTMLPLALVGSVVGSLAIGLIAEFYLLIVMLAMTLYFFL